MIIISTEKDQQLTSQEHRCVSLWRRKKNFNLQQASAEDPVCVRAAENQRDAFHMERRLQQGVRSHPRPGKISKGNNKILEC